MNNREHDTNTTKERCRRRWAILTVLIGAAVWALTVTATVHAFQVCARNCALGDAACAASVAACETKIHAYNLYMAQMGAEVTMRQLPAVYQDALRSRYPLANFGAYRFGFSDRQPPNNATTDCATTYFNSRDYADILRTAAANPDLSWLLHEVTHVEQCTAAGGREAYAKRWWDEMEAALIARGRRVDFTQPPDQLANQMGALFLSVHDAMPMELAADNKANSVRGELVKCCVDQDGKPIRPLNVAAIDNQSDAGSTLRRVLTAKAENGDPPFTSKWRIKGPGDRTYVEQPQKLVNGLRLLWTPPISGGEFSIEVEVSQRGTSLDHQKLTRTIVIQSPKPLPENLGPGPAIPQIPKEVPPPSKPGLLSPGGPVPPMPPGPSPGPDPTKPTLP